MVRSSLYVNHILVASVLSSLVYLELAFSAVSESATGYTFTPCVGSFTSPGIDTRYKGSPPFIVSSERHRQCEVNEIA